MANDLFEFAAPAEPKQQEQQPVWKLLTVEDDPTYRASLIHSLNGFRFRDTPLQILTAGSAAEAGNVLAEHNDIALILLDVVMEQDDSGLRLVRSIREVLGNSTIRIVLLTGQLGMAPRVDVMQRYDIDEYWNKSELTRETLYSVVSSHLRTWHYMVELQRAQQGLQMILDASRSLYSRHDKNEFTQQILENICKVISIDAGGIVCAARGVHATSLKDINIIAASGAFYPLREQHFPMMYSVAFTPPYSRQLMPMVMCLRRIFRCCILKRLPLTVITIWFWSTVRSNYLKTKLIC